MFRGRSGGKTNSFRMKFAEGRQREKEPATFARYKRNKTKKTKGNTTVKRAGALLGGER